METQNKGKQGKFRKYKVTDNEGTVAHIVIGMTRRKQLEKEGWIFEDNGDY